MKTDKPRLLVIGHARHGKDTVCELLVDRLGYQYKSSSMWAAEKFIFLRFQATFPGKYASVMECWLDRENHRKLWHDWIREYNEGDLSRMARGIYSEFDIYCGLRNREEYYAILEKCRPDHIIWVDACNRLPREPANSFQLEYLDASYFFDNNGTKSDLEVEFNLMVRSLNLGISSE